jgi:hypothetical protein
MWPDQDRATLEMTGRVFETAVPSSNTVAMHDLEAGEMLRARDRLVEG